MLITKTVTHKLAKMPTDISDTFENSEMSKREKGRSMKWNVLLTNIQTLSQINW